jgi:hypothetical protein
MSPSASAVLLGSLLLTACTSWKLEQVSAPFGPLAPPPEGMAKVCVVRTSVLAAAVTFPTHDDGVLVGATRGPGHFCYFAEPGDHTITVDADEPEMAILHAEPGRNYYLAEEVDNILGWVKCRALWLAETEAKERLDGTYYERLVAVPGTETLPPPVPMAPARVVASRE